MENNNLQNTLLKQVKKNKKYRTISNDIVINEIKDYLKSNSSLVKSNKISKQTIKDIRARLHRKYSSFQTKKKRRREKYLQELKKLIKNKKNIEEITNKLLSLTLSTKERLNDYKNLYKEIFKITNKPKTITDLGSGLNPLSYPLMDPDNLTYYSYDIDNEDINFLNDYFEIMKPLGLSGKAEILDVRDLNKIKKIPESDIIFLFKLVDLIDIRNHKPSEEIITTLFEKNKSRYIVASFATKTLTRKPMNFPKRKWFELMLERTNLKFKTIESSNEVFYVVWK